MKNITQLVHSKPYSNWNIPIIKGVAIKGEGVNELIDACIKHQTLSENTKRTYLLTEKAFRLIQNEKMKGISKKELQEKIADELKKTNFNLYRFVKNLL